MASAFDYESLEEEIKARLRKGEVVTLSKRPDETADPDKRFVTLAQLLDGTQRELWDVIHDKEDAELFVDGVLESKVIESSETEILVEQKTRVGGPKGAYYYQLRHTLTPFSRSDFEFVTGEMRDVIGSWWILDGPDEKRCLVVYTLHIDPGIFAPQIVVKRGMKKSMPGTLKSMQREVLKRRETNRNETR
ncbi:MAG: SRPBCC family protein [Verrucomicrobiales bacterium]|nr:SRPBCC family protein [Verrucomicrobiales bacterium]